MTRFDAVRGWVSERHPVIQFLYKLLIAVVGGVIIFAGLLMLVLPGPGWLTVFAGLAVLSLEFPLFGRFNRWVKSKVVQLWRKIKPQKVTVT